MSITLVDSLAFMGGLSKSLFVVGFVVSRLINERLFVGEVMNKLYKMVPKTRTKLKRST